MPGFGIERDQRAAYVKWLHPVRWQIFGTLTFAWRVSDAQGTKVFDAFINQLETTLRAPIAYVRGDEKRFPGFGKPEVPRHYHVLMTSERQLDLELVRATWTQMAGGRSKGAAADVRVYNRHENAVAYTLKFSLDGRGDWHFKNIDLFLEPNRNGAITCRNRRRLSRHFRRIAEADSDAWNPISVRASRIWARPGMDSGKKQKFSLNPSTRGRVSHGGDMTSSTRVSEKAKEALSLDKQLRTQWTEIKTAERALRKASIPFGKTCEKMRAMEAHRYIPQPGSRKTYMSFEEYIHGVTGGEVSKSTLYIAIACYKLTEGPNALAAEDVAEMPAANAYELYTKLKPEYRTADIVEAAKKTPKRCFSAKIQAKLNEYLPSEQQRIPRIDFFRRLHHTVANKLEETIERFTHLPVVRDGDPDLTLQEKAIYAICLAAEQFAVEQLAQAEEGVAV